MKKTKKSDIEIANEMVWGAALAALPSMVAKVRTKVGPNDELLFSESDVLGCVTVAHVIGQQFANKHLTWLYSDSNSETPS